MERLGRSRGRLIGRDCGKNCIIRVNGDGGRNGERMFGYFSLNLSFGFRYKGRERKGDEVEMRMRCVREK